MSAVYQLSVTPEQIKWYPFCGATINYLFSMHTKYMKPQLQDFVAYQWEIDLYEQENLKICS